MASIKFILAIHTTIKNLYIDYKVYECYNILTTNLGVPL